MSLLTQYLKTIADEGAPKAPPAALPSLFKTRQKHSLKGWRVLNATLLMLVFMAAAALIFRRSPQQMPSDLVNSGVARVENGPAPSAPAVTRALSHQLSQASFENAPEPQLSELSEAMHPKNETKDQTGANQNAPPAHAMGRAAAISPATAAISSEEGGAAVQNVTEETPSRSSLPLQLPEEGLPSVKTVVTTPELNEPIETPLDVAQNYYQLGLITLQEGELSDAEKYFREALKCAPNHVNALLNLSNVYIQQKRFDSAAKTLETCLQFDPDHVKALDNLGYIALRQRNYKEARRYYEAALLRDPVDEVALVNLAYLAQSENDRVEALRWYEKLISINPEDGRALVNAAHLMAQEGQIERAIQLYNRCLTLKGVQNDRNLVQKIRQRIKVMLASK
jgi:tetratricopeptide (TPR) repeat protein